MLVGDAPRPPSRKRSLERFRLANSFERAASNVVDEGVLSCRRWSDRSAAKINRFPRPSRTKEFSPLAGELVLDKLACIGSLDRLLQRLGVCGALKEIDRLLPALIFLLRQHNDGAGIALNVKWTSAHLVHIF